MNALEFLEVCRTINCLSYSEFQKMYPTSLCDHIWGKFLVKRINLVFELDNENMEILYKFALNKIKNRKKS